MAKNAAVLAALREHLAKVAPVRVRPGRRKTGLSALDAATGGWPQPGISLVHGAPGTGRLGLVLPALRAETARGNTVAIIDAEGWLYPPGLPGVTLEHLLVVRPGPSRAAWATEQVVRCGAIPFVVLLDPPPLRRAGRRLQHATEAGMSALVVISSGPQRDLPVGLRITQEDRDHVQIERGGRTPDVRRVVLREPMPVLPSGT